MHTNHAPKYGALPEGAKAEVIVLDDASGVPHRTQVFNPKTGERDSKVSDK